MFCVRKRILTTRAGVIPRRLAFQPYRTSPLRQQLAFSTSSQSKSAPPSQAQWTPEPPKSTGASTSSAESLPEDSPKHVENWLSNLGLSKHFKAFEEHGFDSAEALRGMNEADLVKVGVQDADEREKILRKLARFLPPMNVFQRVEAAWRIGSQPDFRLSADTIISDAQPIVKSQSSSTSKEADKSDKKSPEPASKAKKEKKPRPFWHYAVVLSFFIAYFAKSYNAKEEARDRAGKSFACNRREIIDLIKRTQFTLDELHEIHRFLRKHFPTGVASLDEFGTLMQEITKHFKEQRESNNGTSQASSESETKNKKELEAWDLLLFFRNSQVDSSRGVSVSEILSALSVLCKDIDRPQDKIELLWNVTCEDFGLEPDRSTPLPKDAVTLLIDRMVRFCHFDSERLVRKSSYLPPDFETFTAQEISNLYFRELDLQERTKDMAIPVFRGLIRKKDDISRRYLDGKDTALNREQMTLKDFQDISIDLGKARMWRWRLTVWYLSKFEIRRLEDRRKAKEKKAKEEAAAAK